MNLEILIRLKKPRIRIIVAEYGHFNLLELAAIVRNIASFIFDFIHRCISSFNIAPVRFSFNWRFLHFSRCIRFSLQNSFYIQHQQLLLLSYSPNLSVSFANEARLSSIADDLSNSTLIPEFSWSNVSNFSSILFYAILFSFPRLRCSDTNMI